MTLQQNQIGRLQVSNFFWLLAFALVVRVIDSNRQKSLMSWRISATSDPLDWLSTCQYMIRPDIDVAPNLKIMLFGSVW